MQSPVWIFLLLVWKHWEPLVLGGVVGVIVLVLEHRTKKPIRWKFLGYIMLVALLMSCFRAWREEYASAEWRGHEISRLQGVVQTKDSQIQDLKKEAEPNFTGGIQQSVTGNPGPPGQPGNSTDLFMAVMLVNKGAPSVAIGWWIDIKSPSLNIPSLDPTTLVRSDHYFYSPTKQNVSIFEQGSLSDKASQPIARGGIASGWLKFVLKGRWEKELTSKDTLITLHFTDFTNRPYSLQFRPSGPGAPTVLPGMEKH